MSDIKYPLNLERYFQDNACPHCDAGQVDLMIQGEIVETIKCDTCSGFGWLVPSERAKVMGGVNALKAAISDADKF